MPAALKVIHEKNWERVGSSIPFLEKILFHMGIIVSTVFPSLVPLQRIDDCVEIHILHFVIRFKSTKISALGTTVPVRLLQEALAILVLKQMSQFRSFGK